MRLVFLLQVLALEFLDAGRAPASLFAKGAAEAWYRGTSLIEKRAPPP